LEKPRYRVYSEYLREKHGCKVYKLPVNLPVTCPNRDGELAYGGCIFCGESGAGFEALPEEMPVKKQLEKNMEFIGEKYSAKKFIAYFQNFTNTYMHPGRLLSFLDEVTMPGIVEVYISTRPDCISDRHLEAAADFSRRTGKEVTFELGLQTVNYHSLVIMNRGHTLAEFIDGVQRMRGAGFHVCAHLILDLPWDDMTDVVENAKILSALGVEQVKLHSLYIVKGTELARMYEQKSIRLLTMEEYAKRVIAFLENLSPDIVIQRLIGRAPEEETLTANWDTSWWKVKEYIEKQMVLMDTWQGKKFNYLGGKAVRKFL
jgi:radical SAM protein (TIGR01212 family)